MVPACDFAATNFLVINDLRGLYKILVEPWTHHSVDQEHNYTQVFYLLLISKFRMNKLILASLLVVALLALVGANDVAARSGRRVSNRGELRKGNRGRLGLNHSRGLRAGNRVGARRGSGSRLGYGNRFAGERYNNLRAFNDFDYVDDYQRSNALRIAIEKENNVASHRAVSVSNGIQHNEGERVLADNRIDAEHYDNEAIDAANHVDAYDNTHLDAAHEDNFWKMSAFDRRGDDFFTFSDW